MMLRCSRGVQGSLVTQHRLRFDFNLHRGLKGDEIARVEELVNGWVAADTELVTKEMPLAEAKAAGEGSRVTGSRNPKTSRQSENRLNLLI